MLRKIRLEEINGGINLIDLGSSGRLDPYWSPLERLLNLYAFDPNEEECRRLAASGQNYMSAHYIPTAIAGKDGDFTLYKTKSVYCWSLLEPNADWLSRFSFHDSFLVDEISQIRTRTLEDIDELKGVEIDAVKSDTQGLELPIFQSSPNIIGSSFLLQTETGFVENYKGETTFQQISSFMKDKDFLLFDLDSSNRISRKNHFSRKTHNQEILWCEATWLKDYVAIEQREGLDIDRAKALKALILCANHGCIDYGFELATLFMAKKLIGQDEYELLRDERSWVIPNDRRAGSRRAGMLVKAILNCIPNRWSSTLGHMLLEVSQKPNPLKSLFK